MANSKEIGKIYRTEDYSIFRRLEGNRSVPSTRINKIIKSITSFGYILSPILVNEKFEVIDGQGRLEALKRLGLPVDYIIVHGAGIDECIAMNIYQTSWGMEDYIESNAEKGNASYMYLKQLLQRFKGQFNFRVIVSSLTGKDDSQNSKIKDGSFTCTINEYEYAVAVLNYLINFKPIIDKVGGRTECYYTALAFCYRDPEVDNDRLLRKMKQLCGNLNPIINIQQALDAIEAIYNNRSKDPVYILTNYRKYLNGKYKWYESRYGKKYEEE